MILRNTPTAKVRLHKSGGGVFEITVDGGLRFSKKAAGRFPTRTRKCSAPSADVPPEQRRGAYRVTVAT